MPMNPAIRYVQLGIASMGVDPGPGDGWWGPRTTAAARHVAKHGPVADTSQWAVHTLQRGLGHLGWDPGPEDGLWGPSTRAALAALIAAGGAPKASHVMLDVPDYHDAKTVPAPPAKASEIRQGRASYLVDEVMIHTTATPAGFVEREGERGAVEAIRRFHTLSPAKGGRGWRAIGYHGLVLPSGAIHPGRPYAEIGAGARGHNRGVIHLSMFPVRTITRMGEASDFYTPQQLDALRAEIASIGRRTPIRIVTGHNAVAAKLCPGFVVRDSDWSPRSNTLSTNEA